jgi:hypothetical protein
VWEHFPNYQCECRKSERSHRCAAGIEAHRETTPYRYRNPGFLLLFSLMLIDECRAPRKDRRKRQKESADRGSEGLGDKPRTYGNETAQIPKALTTQIDKSATVAGAALRCLIPMK